MGSALEGGKNVVFVRQGVGESVEQNVLEGGGSVNIKPAICDGH